MLPTKKKYRSRLGIVLDILEAIHELEYASVTEIITYANIPYNRLKKILDRLLKKGYIDVMEEQNKKIYTLKPAGYKLMNELRKIKELMTDLGLEV